MDANDLIKALQKYRARERVVHIWGNVVHTLGPMTNQSSCGFRHDGQVPSV